MVLLQSARGRRVRTWTAALCLYCDRMVAVYRHRELWADFPRFSLCKCASYYSAARQGCQTRRLSVAGPIDYATHEEVE